jgi:hypothetical protein
MLKFELVLNAPSLTTSVVISLKFLWVSYIHFDLWLPDENMPLTK